MKSFIIRGSFSNHFELQNYEPIAYEFNLKAVASYRPITATSISTVQLPSPVDLPNFPYKMPVLNRFLIDAHFLFGLEKIIDGADLVHVAETYYGYTRQAVQMRKNRRIKKLISTAWETIPHNNEGIWGRSEWKKQAIEVVDAFITPTNRAKNALIEEGCDPQKIKVIPMGVDLARFSPSEKKTPKRIRLLFVGRLVPEKGVYTLLKAVKMLGNDFTLTLIGQGEIKAQLDKNTIVKNVDYSHLHEEYQQADIFIFPSMRTHYWEEQYGMALVEAMASGLPIVASNSGAIPEVLGNAGTLFPEGDINALSESIARFSRDLQFRKDFGELARLRAEKIYDRNKTAHQIEKVYNELYA